MDQVYHNCRSILRTYHIIFAPALFGPGGYGGKIIKDDKQHAYALIRSSNKKTDLPLFQKNVPIFAIHEWMHAYINDEVATEKAFIDNENLDELMRPVYLKMVDQSYTDIETFLIEQIVRSIVLKVENELQGEEMYKNGLSFQVNSGFYLTEYTIELLNFMLFIENKIRENNKCGESSDFYYGIREITEKLLETKNYTHLAYIYETLGTLSRNMCNLNDNEMKEMSSHSNNYINVTLINLSCYCYYAATQIEYAESLAKTNYINFIAEIELVKKLEHIYSMKVIMPYNIELLGDICSFFDVQKAKQYYAESQNLFEKLPIYDQGGETNDYYFSINVELSRVIEACFDIKLEIIDDGIERINEKESFMKRIMKTKGDFPVPYIKKYD